jgi:hypothetical protein
MASLPVKTFACAVGFVFVLASSADAKKPRKPRVYARAPTVVTVNPYDRGANLFPPGPVIYMNEYLGYDPDPFIRMQIWRDLGAYFSR